MRDYFDRAAEHGMSKRKAELANRTLDSMESDIRLIIENAGPNTNYERAGS